MAVALSMQIPFKGSWKALASAAWSTRYVLLEDFRFHPIADGTARVRRGVCSDRLRLQAGTPIRVDGQDSVVVLPDDRAPLVRRVDDDRVMCVPVESVAYRMDMTLDDFAAREPPTKIVCVDGAHYLVPTTSLEPAVALPDDADEETNAAVAHLLDASPTYRFVRLRLRGARPKYVLGKRLREEVDYDETRDDLILEEPDETVDPPTSRQLHPHWRGTLTFGVGYDD